MLADELNMPIGCKGHSRLDDRPAMLDKGIQAFFAFDPRDLIEQC
jgi:hypothetical protein